MIKKKSFSILKNSRVHTTTIMIKAQRNYIIGIIFRMILYVLNHAMRINRWYRSLVWTLISLSLEVSSLLWTGLYIFTTWLKFLHSPFCTYVYTSAISYKFWHFSNFYIFAMSYKFVHFRCLSWLVFNLHSLSNHLILIQKLCFLTHFYDLTISCEVFQYLNTNSYDIGIL